MKKALLLLGMAAFLVSGCYTVKLETPGLKNVASFSALNGKKVADFSKDYRQWYVLWGLIPLGQPDLKNDLENEVRQAGGKSVANLQVETGMDFPWILLNAITGYITVVNTHALVQGDIIK